MNKIPEKYLPIGTVVMLKGGTKRVMIAGFCATQSEDEDKKIWDYSGCLYPEGFLTSNQTCLFDHDQIEQIYHMGLSGAEDDEEKEFKEKLQEIIKEINNADNNNE